ncbi:MAG: glycosyl transferase family 36 [Candidatus Riflebacteria bacterium]|nr:glycosyl transferase family 36 [Candidatus Riflebacteria bacterium]
MERKEKLLEGRYGYFADKGASYVISDWKTPRPWINVISNGTWGLTVSQAGGGYSWLSHSMLNRITRWNQDMIQDRDGKFIFLKDLDDGNVWSLTPQPLKPVYDEYECVHGMGFTTFSTRLNGISSEWTLFVPPGFSSEFWNIAIKNDTYRPRKLSLVTYFEYLLGAFPDWHREFHKLFIRTSYSPADAAIIADSTLWTANIPADPGWNKDWPYTCFFIADRAPNSLTCSKEEFFGQYNDWKDACAWKADKFSNLTGTGFDQIASMRFDIYLKPGESTTIGFCLGAVEKEAGAQVTVPIPEKYTVAVRSRSSELLAETKSVWLQLCERLIVETPDPAVNVLVNYWLKYQTISCRLFGRTAFYQCGGALGFRDQLQDSLIYLTLDPAKTRDQILLHARHQNSDGTVQHWWHPISEEGRLTDISDDLLWLPYLVVEYLKETNDSGILDVVVPYLDKGEGTLYEHCKNALNKVLERRSSRGLALIGEGDWNDGLNAVGPKWKGESVWLSHFLYGILRDFAKTACWGTTGRDPDMAQSYEDKASDLKKAILKNGWDGSWFFRATTDDGKTLGSQSCREGKIFLNAQTWAVINGIVEGDEARKLLSEVEKWLYKDYGVLLFTPAFTEVDRNVGYLTRYSPGIRENGGVYTHAATWAMLAQSIAGNSDKVYDTFQRLSPPLLSNRNADRYKGEPYVTPGNIEGPESPHEGQGAWTWYSGSAGWLYKVIVERLLGVRVENGDLIAKPNIPSDWPGFTMKRLHNGKQFMIYATRIENEKAGSYSIRIEEKS